MEETSPYFGKTKETTKTGLYEAILLRNLIAVTTGLPRGLDRISCTIGHDLRVTSATQRYERVRTSLRRADSDSIFDIHSARENYCSFFSEANGREITGAYKLLVETRAARSLGLVCEFRHEFLLILLSTGMYVNDNFSSFSIVSSGRDRLRKIKPEFCLNCGQLNMFVINCTILVPTFLCSDHPVQKLEA